MRENYLSQAEALERLESTLSDFQPLELVGVDAQPADRRSPRPDWVLNLAWEGRRERFGVEFKSPCTPKRLREAAAQARSYADSGYRPMVMGPYLDEGALDWLLEEGISGIDFSGNGVVIVPGSWLVYRTGAPNAYPASRYIKSIYRGRSSLVGRVLLLCNRFDTVTGVREEILRRGGRISLATVSKVLSSLEEELLVSRTEGVRLLQPDQLLERLVASFQRPEVRRRVTLRADDLDRVRSKMMNVAEAEGVELAARGDGLYTSFPGAAEMLSAYTADFDTLISALDLPEARRFPELEVLETTDELVFFDRRMREGLLWTSPLQVYLELATGDKRAREVSEQLRVRLLSGELS